MRNTETGFFATLFHLGYKTILAIASVIFITALTLSAGCAAFYKSVKNSISLQGQLNAKQSAEEFKNYLLSNENSIHLTAYTLNEMIDQKATSEEMLHFMVNETNNIQNSFDENFTGLYGWINGRYLDGGGWVPDENYVATERPWYTTTILQDEQKITESNIVFIKPYIDMQTQTTMMTISTLLNDGQSVVALDIRLTKLQEMINLVSQNSEDSHIMILDYDGDVVVHSDKNVFYDADNRFNELITNKIFDEKLQQFDIKYNGKKYIIYAEKLEGGWYSISAINANKFYRPLHHIMWSSVFAVLLTAVIILVIFVNISRKNIITKTLNVRLQAIADIYYSMYDIDLVENVFTCIQSQERIDKVIGASEGRIRPNARETLYKAMNHLTDEISKPIINKFIDFSTLEERLAGTNTITEEFLGTAGIWCRGRFIVAERDAKGSPSRVLWVVESIDKEKRHRDELKHRSETDSLTDINNRGSGEYKISKLLTKNQSGMFILLDVDDFKSINDVYGHNTGDKVLISIAHALKNAFRSGDVIMRLGGDEFVAFAVGVHSPEEGMHAINRLFKNIDDIKIKELAERKVCVSVGAYCHNGNDNLTFKDLYKLADKCTYSSKKKEGNAVTFFEK